MKTVAMKTTKSVGLAGATGKGQRWYWRLTGHQEAKLVTAIGEVRGLYYEEALSRLSHPGVWDQESLKKIVLEAVERAGDNGCPPLVDDRLVAALPIWRPRSYQPPWASSAATRRDITERPTSITES